MIQFYGAQMSSAGRTRWMLEEVGVAYEYHRVNVRDEAVQAEFRAINPGGKIPFLVDGEFSLAESAAINFYLAETYKPELLPADAHGRARALQWSFWAMTNLQPKALEVMFHSAMLPPDKRNPETLASAKQACQGLFDYFETELGEFLVGAGSRSPTSTPGRWSTSRCGRAPRPRGRRPPRGSKRCARGRRTRRR